MKLQTRLRTLAHCLVIFALCSSAGASGPSGNTAGKSDLSDFSLEELTKIEVSSVSRKDQELYKTPAAVYVITREDIRSSGVSNLPDFFRMVPGMQVAQVSANEWGVSARGFNSHFADKMLVLIDGRSIYSEIYSGVFWDQNDLLLEDIDRIEIIRGPGGKLWGANAVNGIINIITLKAKQTHGTATAGEWGGMNRVGSLRYGGQLGDKLRTARSSKISNALSYSRMMGPKHTMKPMRCAAVHASIGKPGKGIGSPFMVTFTAAVVLSKPTRKFPLPGRPRLRSTK
jgi:iron complex outermembrane receptor protein